LIKHIERNIMPVQIRLLSILMVFLAMILITFQALNLFYFK